jgi:uncharacterized membrane protein (UPF0127 family)
MRIINRTKNVLLAQDTLMADSLFKRLKGLLGKEAFKPGQALVIKPCNSVHTFFMPFPIDILFVDRNHKVTKAITSLRPFRITPFYFNACFAIELPSGTIASSFTTQGDSLSIE